MSKTYGEKSAKLALMEYWKRFAALGTGFAYKYRFDPFFRTEFNVIGLQILFALFVLLVVTQGVGLKFQKFPVALVVGLSTTLFVYLITRVALAPARNALDAQKQFIGNIAHELRTPLSVIKTNSEVALLDRHIPLELKETLVDTIDELDRISDIINNLLSLNVLVQQEEMTFTNVDIDAVINRMAKHLENLIAKRRLRLTIVRGEYQTVWANTAALEQIVMNVLKNAVNYTLPDGTIRVSTRADYQGHVTIAIEDSGIGIDERDLRRIFEPFFRTDQSRARISGGSGLGLAIVNELVKLHRGSMLIRSAKDVGTSVYITLHRGRDQARISMERRKRVSEVKRERRKKMAQISVDYSHLPFARKNGRSRS